MFDCPDYIKPEYVAYRTYQDRYSDLEDEEEERMFDDDDYYDVD